MVRRLSIASDASSASAQPLRKHDCLLGELHSAYDAFCKKVMLACSFYSSEPLDFATQTTGSRTQCIAAAGSMNIQQ